MILAEQKPASARVIAAVIFLVRFWIEPKMNAEAQKKASILRTSRGVQGKRDAHVLRIISQRHKGTEE
jgi:negative regulator of sigma E activity